MASEGNITGAIIEHGKIISAANGQYIVQSFTRDGVVTLPLDTLYGTTETYAEGDKVYFFAFCDGHGMILRKINM